MHQRLVGKHTRDRSEQPQMGIVTRPGEANRQRHLLSRPPFDTAGDGRNDEHVAQHGVADIRSAVGQGDARGHDRAGLELLPQHPG